MNAARQAYIRALNDRLRQHHEDGTVVMTAGVAALGPRAVQRVFEAVATFDDFCKANDPHDERDFGGLMVDDEGIFFKIDYYDVELRYHSPDPADPSVTRRVITLMLVEEY